MERKTFSVLFIIKKSKLLKSGEAPIEVRISFGCQKAELRIGRSILPSKWLPSNGGRVVGKDRKSLEVAAYIEMARLKLNNIQQNFEKSGVLYNVSMIKEAFLGKGQSQRTLCSIFEEHNNKCRELIGNGYEKVTINRYDNCLKSLRQVIKEQYSKDDILLSEVSTELVRNMEHHLKTRRGCAQNTVIRYMKCLKKITNMAIANDWMSRDPFAGVRFHEVPVNKDFLTKQEIDKLIEMDFEDDTLNTVRDVFIFQIYTGLAYVDLYNLSPDDILVDTNGRKWIHKARHKTNNMCDIPLLRIPQEIISRYADHKRCVERGTLLPVALNQNMNSFLKRIATICGIKKVLTTHTARRTFATTITLANDVSITSVSKMMGHTTVRMTQRYAKVLSSSIMREMDDVEKKLSSEGDNVAI